MFRYAATYLLLVMPLLADWPTILQGDVKPGDKRLTRAIDPSKKNELTIASFSVRKLGIEERSLNDFAMIADLVDEADVVVFREIGGRAAAVAALMQANLGTSWRVISTKVALLAYRVEAFGFKIAARFDREVEIGEDASLVFFEITTIKGKNKRKVKIGSVHIKKNNPERGLEIVQASAWLVDQREDLALVMGDFSWGYGKRGSKRSFRGEKSVRTLHRRKKIFQVFHNLSYLGAAPAGKLRTNLAINKQGYFFDQILLSPPLTAKLAHGGRFLQDCGIVAFDLRPHMKKTRQRLHKRAVRALDRYVARAESFDEKLYEKVLRDSEKRTNDDATHLLSGHRVIWVQFKIW